MTMTYERTLYMVLYLVWVSNKILKRYFDKTKLSDNLDLRVGMDKHIEVWVFAILYTFYKSYASTTKRAVDFCFFNEKIILYYIRHNPNL